MPAVNELELRGLWQAVAVEVAARMGRSHAAAAADRVCQDFAERVRGDYFGRLSRGEITEIDVLELRRKGGGDSGKEVGPSRE